MKTLDLISIDCVNKFASPLIQENLSIQSPALIFFTDFEKIKPLVIDSNSTALEAKNLMMKTHVRLKLVLNHKNEFIGIVSADDLADRKIMQKVANGELRNEIPVTDCMIPKSRLKAIDYDQLSDAIIADVINTLKESGQQHCLVVEPNKGVIRGLFSVSDISRKLHVNIDIRDAPSFLKLASALD